MRDGGAEKKQRANENPTVSNLFLLAKNPRAGRLHDNRGP